MSKFLKALENAERDRGSEPVLTAPVETIPAPPEPDRDPTPVYGAPVTREHRSGTSLRGAFDEDAAPLLAEPGELDDHLVSLLAPTSYAAEQYRAVRLAIETFRSERNTGVVAISSAGRGEGKTISAINVAGALAQSPDARVALVEADLRHPRIAGYLGLPLHGGLSSYLRDAALPPDSVLDRPATLAFATVLAGPVSSMPYELLKSSRFAALMAWLRERFDFVVVDTPPVLLFPDVAILRDLVDGFIVVVRANRTSREMLRESVTTIGRPRALGVIFNEDDREPAPAYAENGDHPRWRRYLVRGAA